MQTKLEIELKDTVYYAQCTYEIGPVQNSSGDPNDTQQNEGVVNIEVDKVIDWDENERSEMKHIIQQYIYDNFSLFVRIIESKYI
jgi:hypothetical protein